MKYFFLLVGLVVLLNSCSVDDPKIFAIENATLVEVVRPDTLIYQQNAQFDVTFRLPTSCHRFEGFVVQEAGQSRTIRTEIRYDETFDCEDTPNETETRQYEFFVENLEDYTFRFLRGASDTGFQYFEFQLPVKVE
jgi:hypothetical protein